MDSKASSLKLTLFPKKPAIFGHQQNMAAQDLSPKYFSSWLTQPDQHCILCCHPKELITPDNEVPNPSADTAIWRFANAVFSAPFSTADLAQVLPTAPYIIEVERVLLTPNLGTSRSARYFVPVGDTGEYLEVHAWDAFGGANPFNMTSARYRQKRYNCPDLAHQPRSGNLTRFIWLISREGCVDAPLTREPTGEWVKCTLGRDWGVEV